MGHRKNFWGLVINKMKNNHNFYGFLKNSCSRIIIAIASIGVMISVPNTLPAKEIKAKQAAEAINIITLKTTGNELVNLKANEAIEILGNKFISKSDSQFVKTISSEFISLSITSGLIILGNKKAKTGEAFIIPISGDKVQKFSYDAARLLATIEPEWSQKISANLIPIIKSQNRLKYWGLLEPIGVNTSAPLPPYIERVRASYLTNPTILELRHKSRGEAGVLNLLTVQKFQNAINKNDIDTIAALIDPLPFTDSSDDATVWLKARTDFASNLTNDSAMKSAFSAGNLSQDPLLGIFYIGPEGSSFKITTVNRDSAVFIAAVEPVK